MNRTLATLSVAVSTAAASLAVAVVPAHASHLFDFGADGSFQFAADTALQFTFLESRGNYKASLGVFDSVGGLLSTLFAETKNANPGSSNANDWLNDSYVTPGSKTASYTFNEGTAYKLGLWKGSPANATFDVKQVTNSYTFPSTGPGYTPAGTKTIVYDGTILGFEDGFEAKSGGKGDYNDFIVGVTPDVASTPEPTAMLGLGAIALLGAIRRRRSVS